MIRGVAVGGDLDGFQKSLKLYSCNSNSGGVTRTDYSLLVSTFNPLTRGLLIESERLWGFFTFRIVPVKHQILLFFAGRKHHPINQTNCGKKKKQPMRLSGFQMILKHALFGILIALQHILTRIFFRALETKPPRPYIARGQGDIT